MHITPLRSYRCYYYPRHDEPAHVGVLPFVQLKASDADSAQRLAQHVTARPVAIVERREVLQ